MAESELKNQERKKIVIDARESGASTGRYVDNLIKHLHLLNTDYRFILLAKEHRVDYLSSIAPKFEIEITPFKEFSFGEQLGFRKQIESLNADLVHFPMVQQPIFYQGPVVTSMLDLTTARFSNPSKNKLVFWLKQRIYIFVNKRVAIKSRRIIAISNHARSDIAEFTNVPESKITVTYMAAEPITERPRSLQSLFGDDYIMYLGRPQTHKNLDRLVEAFGLLKDTHPQLKLVLIGKTDELYKMLERRVRAQHVNDVVFTGFVSDAQLRWLYENTRAYIFPSLSEGFGLPGLEAMAQGAPVVSSNAGPLPEVYGKAAHYFDPKDPKDIAAKIGEVLDDKKLHAKLIRAGRRQAAKYSWRQTAEQTMEVYRDVLGDSPTA